MSEEKMRETFEFARKQFPSGEAIVTIRRAAKIAVDYTAHMQEEVDRLKAENAKLRAWHDNVVAYPIVKVQTRISGAFGIEHVDLIRKPEPLEE